MPRPDDDNDLVIMTTRQNSHITLWLSDVFTPALSQLPGEHTARLPHCAQSLFNHTITVQSGTHSLLGRKSADAREVPRPKAQRHTAADETRIKGGSKS